MERPGRRWDDRPGTVPALTFARFLTTGPTLDEAMRFLVGLLSWPISAYGAWVVRPAGDHIVVAARYDEPIDDGRSVADDDEVGCEVAAIISAVEGAHPVLWTAPDQPWMTPMAAWPLNPVSGRGEFLVLLLAARWDPERVAERTSFLADVLAVYVAGAGAGSRLRSASPETRVTTPHLTDRQLRVLGLLDQDLTLAQIASRIDFSESTVRAESLAIYRALCVHDRDAALAAARELGLLPLRKSTTAVTTTATATATTPVRSGPAH